MLEALSGGRLAPESAEELSRYVAMLEAEADLLGLTRLSGDSLVQELILDSLTLLPHVPEGAQVVDVGSGGGVPGIPLAVARPDLQVLLVESSRRKAGFLERAAAALPRGRLSVACARAEDLGQDPAYRERFDVAVAKAVAPLRVLLELTCPLVQVGGLVLTPKGPRFETELEEASTALHTLNLESLEPLPYQLEEKSYVLGRFRKTAPTPTHYPRRAGRPAKSPL